MRIDQGVEYSCALGPHALVEGDAGEAVGRVVRVGLLRQLLATRRESITRWNGVRDVDRYKEVHHADECASGLSVMHRSRPFAEGDCLASSIDDSFVWNTLDGDHGPEPVDIEQLHRSKRFVPLAGVENGVEARLGIKEAGTSELERRDGARGKRGYRGRSDQGPLSIVEAQRDF